MISRGKVMAIAGFALASASFSTAVSAQQAICYNCPPQWADWKSQLEAVKKNTGIALPHDNKNSGQTLSQLIAEQKNPVADIAYYGVTFGIKAKAKGVTEGYKPKGFDQIPDGLKDPDGHWFTTHFGTLGLFVNKDALGGKPVPKCWMDLTKPDYKGMVGYLDPSSAFVGYAGAVAVNRALGGTLDNFDPGIEFFKKLQEERARSCRSRRPTPASFRVRSRSSSTTTSMPIAGSLPRRGISSLSFLARERWSCPMSRAW